jgi:nucleoside-diphosphate-sugar epimerase
MKILVTGATGVIGSRAIPMLLAAGHEVTAASRSAQADARLAQAGATRIALDLFDRQAVERVVSGHDAVINLATHMPKSSFAALQPGAWVQNDRIRRDASACLVEAAIGAGARLFIQESFAPVYPDCGEAWIGETVPIAPVRYNRTVADAEQSAQRFTRAGRVGIVLRFAAFYGPDSFQMTDFARALRLGWAPIPSRPDAFLSSVSHDDAASAVVAALDAPAGAYNVADDEPLRRAEYFGALAQALGLKAPRIPPAWTARLFGSIGELLARSQRMSNGKLRLATRWSPRYRSVREGFPATIEAMRREGGRPRAEAA